MCTIRKQFNALMCSILIFSTQTIDARVPDSPYASRIQSFRFLEDSSDISEADRVNDWFASIKNVPLTLAGGYATFGGEYRYRFESVNDSRFGLVPATNFNLHLNRLLLHTDVHWSDKSRTFIQLSAYAESGRPVRPRPVDQSEIDIQQAFHDFGKRNANLRIGRQELAFGSGLFTGVREGPNQRRAFDAARTVFDIWGDARLDSFYAHEVVPDQEAFNDRSNNGTEFWGGYGSSIVHPWQGGSIDFYYLGIDRNRGIYNSGTGREKRHTIGWRLTGTKKAFSYDYEAVYQFGSLGTLDIDAWGVFTTHRYIASKWRFSPKFELITNVSSGDSNSADGTLGTFDALFPNNSAITKAATIRRRNLVEFHPTVSLTVGKRVNLSVGTNLLWRTQNSDAIYAANGSQIVAGSVSNNHFIGAFMDIGMKWRVNPYLTVQGTYVHGFAGDSIDDADGSDFDYIYAQTAVKF